MWRHDRAFSRRGLALGAWALLLALAGAGGATAAPWDKIQLPTCVSAGFEQARKEPELTTLLNQSGAASLSSAEQSQLARLKRDVEVLENRRLVYCAADRNRRFAVAGVRPTDSGRLFTPHGRCAGTSVPSVFEPDCRVTVPLAAGQAHMLQVYIEPRSGASSGADGWTGFAGELIFLDDNANGARVASANRLSARDAHGSRGRSALKFPVYASASSAGSRRAGLWIFDPAHADDPGYAFSIFVDLEFATTKVR